jgi:hypothetical protein
MKRSSFFAILASLPFFRGCATPVRAGLPVPAMAAKTSTSSHVPPPGLTVVSYRTTQPHWTVVSEGPARMTVELSRDGKTWERT